MNLVVGNTSQLSHFFPSNYLKISSRNIDFNWLVNNLWDSVYLPFAEQRIYDNNIDYITPNYIYTLKIINFLLSHSKKIVCYTSCELWNNLIGEITLDTAPSFSQNEYAVSKLSLLNKIIELRKINPLYNKVIFIHPFYFNSTYRSQYFLFGKIFNSIKNRQQIEVSNLDFYRDMVHASFVVEKSIAAKQDMMVGSGKLTHIRTFIQDLYKLNNLNFDEFIRETSDIPKNNKLITAKVDWDYSYERLLNDTQADIEEFKEREEHGRYNRITY